MILSLHGTLQAQGLSHLDYWSAVIVLKFPATEERKECMLPYHALNLTALSCYLSSKYSFLCRPTKVMISHVWWYTPIIPELGEAEYQVHEFKVSLGSNGKFQQLAQAT